MPSAQANRIVYLSYGDGPHVAQVTFSVLSVLRFRVTPRGETTPIVIYTDRPQRYEGLGVECVSFSGEPLRAWRGPLGFNHVVKLEVLRYAPARFETACATSTAPRRPRTGGRWQRCGILV